VNIEQVFKIQPWRTIEIYKEVAFNLKQEVPLSESNQFIAAATSTYEDRLRQLWEEFKKNPTEANARKLAKEMKKASEEIWYYTIQGIINLDYLSQAQEDLLREKLEEHHNYIDTSLLPDLLKAIKEGIEDFSNLDYRVIFLYAGALWSFGSLISVTFDGVDLRDLADIFMFVGPNDENTCDGERGCKDHVGKLYTVAEILAENIIPGFFKCQSSCRHMLVPIASPLG